MNLYVYTDESGVFDKYHNDIYVYGGIILLSKDQRDICARKYSHAEQCIRGNKYAEDQELKASFVSNREKGKLFRSLNEYIKFGVVIDESRILDSIFKDKKTKQRYLDYAYKIGLKRCLSDLIQKNILNPNKIHDICVYADEHTTATDGRYELKEGLEQEFKYGTYNRNYSTYFEPLIPWMNTINLKFCNSSCVPLIRAADIVANRIYSYAIRDNCKELDHKIHLTYLP
ncbi:DUF3800 domain-containing protein [Blautia producta]|uniref:DUF3800 domain-containing protein n=1 Tax=Blautia producta TaxID=33035 RepID=UPI00210EAC6C|nr:DUF3800 domain-containing protein [Blautia producta]MCQ5127406.1 DUF3800 domain-containing protein [Blautia producta]